jgi:hypothetical protein
MDQQNTLRTAKSDRTQFEYRPLEHGGKGLSRAGLLLCRGRCAFPSGRGKPSSESLYAGLFLPVVGEKFLKVVGARHTLAAAGLKELQPVPLQGGGGLRSAVSAKVYYSSPARGTAGRKNIPETPAIHTIHAAEGGRRGTAHIDLMTIYHCGGKERATARKSRCLLPQGSAVNGCRAQKRRSAEKEK